MTDKRHLKVFAHADTTLGTSHDAVRAMWMRLTSDGMD